MNGEIVRLRVSAIALDVDGTIADTDPIHGAAWAEALAYATGQSFSIDAYLRACIEGAMSPRDFIREIAPGADLDTVERRKRRIYPDMLTTRLVATPGLPTLLDCAAAADVQVAIVSSSSRSSVDAMLQALWSGPAPSVVVARGDSERSKPSPSPYQAAIASLQLEISEIVAFEDSASGVASATRAGLMCFQVGAREPTGAPRIGDFTNCTIEIESGSAWLVVAVE